MLLNSQLFVLSIFCASMFGHWGPAKMQCAREDEVIEGETTMIFAQLDTVRVVQTKTTELNSHLKAGLLAIKLQAKYVGARTVKYPHNASLLGVWMKSPHASYQQDN